MPRAHSDYAARARGQHTRGLHFGTSRVLGLAIFRREMSLAQRWNRDCKSGHPMRTTLGELVSELVEQYEQLYHDHELAAVAASVTLDDILHENEERKRRPDKKKRR